MEELLQQEDTQHGRFLTFQVGSEFYGLPIHVVTEIVMLQPITSVPEVPDYVRGIINMRGKIVPVIDVRLKFKLPAQDYDDRTCIIVVDVGELSVGLIVDSVAEVVDIDDENVVPPPNYTGSAQSRFILGIGKVGNDVKLLLDVEKLLEDDGKLVE